MAAILLRQNHKQKNHKKFQLPNPSSTIPIQIISYSSNLDQESHYSGNNRSVQDYSI